MRLIGVIAAVAFSSSAFAQPQDCSAVLNEKLLTVQKYSDDVQVVSHFLETVSENVYEKMRANGTLDVFVGQVYVGLTYNEAKDYVKQFAKQTSSRYSYQDNVEYYSASLGPVHAKIYQDCINGRDRELLFVWITKLEPTFVEVKYTVGQLTNTELANFKHFSIRHGDKELRTSPSTPAEKGTFTETIPRKANENVALRFVMHTKNSELVNYSLIIPWVPKLDVVQKNSLRRKSTDREFLTNNFSPLYAKWESEFGSERYVTYEFPRQHNGYLIDVNSWSFTTTLFSRDCGTSFVLVDLDGKTINKPYVISSSRMMVRMRVTTPANCQFYGEGVFSWSEYQQEFVIRPGWTQ
jgi:hypothetical protein